ncbi:hypothetical protein BH11BAC2_BH11BAC2_23040 [soil metagenome]
MDGNYYEAATKKDQCPSDLRGASYATSEVKITAEMQLSWDRGYNKELKQVC